MQRKLIRSMTALSATATVFCLLLLAAGPTQAPSPLATTHPVLVGTAADAALESTDDATTTVHARHHLHRARALLALPYFSFAQGLRRGRS